MRNKKAFNAVFKTIGILLSILLWFLLWDMTARIFEFDAIFPSPKKTIEALGRLIVTTAFWRTVFLSIARILGGLAVGIIVGTAFALICKLLPFTNSFISIGMTVIKSTPVASIVLILWAVMGSSNLPTVIGALMVAPIIWQNLIDGYNAVDKNLLEVAKIFEFSWMKTAKTVYIPTLTRFFVPALLTSVGLAWKSGIAAEIIAYTKNSIGKYISSARTDFSGDEMLAWTVVVVLLSLVFEYSVKLLTRRFREKYAKSH